MITTQYTSLYDMVFNRLDVGEQLRSVQDTHAKGFAGARADPEMDVFGTGKEDLFGQLWEDVKSGEVASRIGNYFLGMVEAGESFVEAVGTLLTDPRKALEGIANLPKTVSIMWKNRDKLWSQFVNASPDEQARMIGRLFGEAELMIATAGAGGGGGAAAGAAPELAEAVQMSGGAAALTRGGAISIDLAKVGGEAARMSALTAQAAKAGESASSKAEALEDTKGAKGGDSWKDLETQADKPTPRKASGGFRSNTARAGDREVIVVEGQVGEPLPQQERFPKSKIEKTKAGEHGTHAVGLQLGENLPEAIRSGPAGELNLSALKTVENATREVMEAAVQHGATVETRTMFRIEHTQIGGQRIALIVGVKREAWLVPAGSDEILTFLEFEARIDAKTRAVSIVRSKLLRPP